MTDTSVNQEMPHSERLMRFDSKTIHAKRREDQHTKQFPLCSYLLQLRAVEVAFLYSTHQLLPRAHITI